MRLTEITIDSFKTVVIPQRLLIEAKVTTLVGPNESGKTNVLQAISALSPKYDLRREDISKSNREKYTNKTLPSLTFTFLLEKEESEIIGKIVPELNNEKTILIERRGNNLENYEIRTNSQSPIKWLTNSKQSVETLKNETREELASILVEIDDFKYLVEKRYGKIIGVPKNTVDKETTRKFNKLISERAQLEEKLQRLDIQTSDLEAKLQYAKEGNLLINSAIKEKLLTLIPQVIYIDNIEKMPESIQIEDVHKQNTAQSIIVANLLELGGLSDFSILDENHRNIKHTLKNVSSQISEKFSKFWSQEKIEIEIEKQGTELAISINGGVSVSSSPKERSEGFQWLLAFFAFFSKNIKDYLRNTIFLLDEPAIRLHPRGQKDLLKFFDDITQNHQIIYSTHSPFLINKNFPQRLRLLRKEDKVGTKISNKPYAENGCRFWEPLKSAIGISLGDMLSLGETNLIVEGISDQLIISNISQRLAELGHKYIDLEKVSIVPSMGATCEEALAKLALSEELDAVSLLDNDAEGKKVYAELSKIPSLKLIKVSELKDGAVTIEDLLPQDTYLKAFNEVCKKFNENFEEISEKNENKTGIVQLTSKYLKDKQYRELDKTAVAKELINNLIINSENIKEYECFEKLFEQINKLTLKQNC